MPQLAGSAISWQNNTLHGTTAFAAELPAGEPGPAQWHATCAPSSRRHARRDPCARFGRVEPTRRPHLPVRCRSKAPSVRNREHHERQRSAGGTGRAPRELACPARQAQLSRHPRAREGRSCGLASSQARSRSPRRPTVDLELFAGDVATEEDREGGGERDGGEDRAHPDAPDDRRPVDGRLEEAVPARRTGRRGGSVEASRGGRGRRSPPWTARRRACRRSRRRCSASPPRGRSPKAAIAISGSANTPSAANASPSARPRRQRGAAEVGDRVEAPGDRAGDQPGGRAAPAAARGRR